METTRRLNPGGLLVGLILMTLGILAMVNELGWGDMGTVVGHWWPVIFIGAGLIQLTQSSRVTVGPLIVMGLGCMLLLSTLNLIGGSIWSLFWPLALVAVGLSVIFNRTGIGGHQVSSDQTFNTFALFSGHDVVSDGSAVRGGWVGAFFGGLTLDLRRARLIADGAQVDATVMFGGIDVLVPKGWRIVVSGVPIFGGYEDKTRSDEPLAADAPTLRINTFVLFGGLVVKHEK